MTREHTNNIMAGLRPPELRELRNVCERSMETLLDGTPGLQLLCFEHGARCEMQHSLCSTGHGHLHEVPLPEDDAAAVLNAVGGQSSEVNSFQEIFDSLALLQEYIVAFSLIPGRSDVRGVVLDASEVPSQYVRRLVADRLGIAGWDWKANQNADLIRRTLDLGFELNKNASVQTLLSSGSVV